MKILHLASEYPPQRIYGLGRAVRELAVAQAALGHDVHVVTNSMSGREHDAEDHGVHVHRVNFPPPPKPADEVTTVVQFNVQLVERVANAPFADRVEVIHSHDWLTGLAGIAIRSLRGGRLALTVHDTAHGKSLGEIDPSRRYVMDIERHSFSEADLLICPSEFIRQEVAVAYGVSGRHVVVVPQGVTPRSWDGEVEPGTVLFIGRLDPEKGVEVLLRAAEDVLAAHPQAKFLIAGTGKLEDALKQQAQPLGQAVEFLGYMADPWPLYRGASVVVVPSLYEPFGLVALEGMVSGRPVIASATGGLAEIVTDGQDGLLVPPGNAQALTEAICRLLSDESLRVSLGQAARWTCQERFSWEAVARGYVAAYRQVLRGPATVLVLADDPEHPLAHESLAALEQVQSTRLRVVREAEKPDLVHLLRTRPDPPEGRHKAPTIETVLTREEVTVRPDEADHVVFAWHDAALDRDGRLDGVALERMSLIYPGVGMAAPKPLSDRSAVRQRLGLPVDVPIVGVFAHSGPHLEAIRQAVPKAHVIQPTEEQIAALDVAVCTEPDDALFRPLVLCGLHHVPVVGPSSGVLAELTENQWAGVFTDGSPEACARAVQGLLADPQQLREQGRMSREIAWTRFSAEKLRERYAQLYDGVLRRPEADADLLLSIVIDVRDRKDMLLRGLETLLRQTAPANAYEIVIVDYGGTDGLRAALPDDRRIRYIYSHSRGMYSHGRARNIGIRAAKGGAITCVDADLLLPPRLVEALLALHRSDRSLVVYADVHRLGAETQQFLEDGERSPITDLQWLRDRADNHFRQAPCGGLQSASRWAWTAIGGYDEDFVGYGMEDVDLADRFHQVGLRSVFHPEVYVLHQHHEHPVQYRTPMIDRRNHTLYHERAGQPIRNQGQAWGQRRPRPVAAGKPRILLVADVPDWALHSIASAISTHLADDFRFETIFRHPNDPAPIESDGFDLIYFLFSGIWTPRTRESGLASKAIVGVHSHVELSPAVWRALDQSRAVCAVSRRLLWECSSRLSTPVTYTPSGVDIDLFRPRPRRCVTSSAWGGPGLWDLTAPSRASRSS